MQSAHSGLIRSGNWCFVIVVRRFGKEAPCSTGVAGRQHTTATFREPRKCQESSLSRDFDAIRRRPQRGRESIDDYVWTAGHTDRASARPSPVPASCCWRELLLLMATSCCSLEAACLNSLPNFRRPCAQNIKGTECSELPFVTVLFDFEISSS